MKPNVGGNQQNLSDTVRGMGVALMLSLLLVYLLMVALYDSYRLPFIIMFAVPVAAVGALTSLAITRQALNLFSLIGTVLLVGLASKNGILLVDFANHMVERGMDRASAMIEAAQGTLPADRHDDVRDDRRHDADRAGARSRRRAASSARHRRDRRLDQFAASYARAGSGHVHVARTKPHGDEPRASAPAEATMMVHPALRRTADAGYGLSRAGA